MITNRLGYRRVTSRIARSLFDIAGMRGKTHAATVRSEFIFTSAPHAMSHASTIVESQGGLTAAWFGGSLEGRPDVSIWVSRNLGAGWCEPQRVAAGLDDGGLSHPCWNPVLFETADDELLLFFKIGPRPSNWWGAVMASHDGGWTWSRERRLPEGIFGPVKNKPVRLANGDILSPSSEETGRWQVHLERSPDLGRSWERIGPVSNAPGIVSIQPSILCHGEGRLQLLCRSKQGHITESWSGDGGSTWSPLAPTMLPNPNSGTDAVTLRDGRQVLVYNHSRRARTPLNLAVSTDGISWKTLITLERGLGEYSYPAVIQSSDDLLHLTYTWNLCRIRHVVIDPNLLA